MHWRWINANIYVFTYARMSEYKLRAVNSTKQPLKAGARDDPKKKDDISAEVMFLRKCLYSIKGVFKDNMDFSSLSIIC